MLSLAMVACSAAHVADGGEVDGAAAFDGGSLQDGGPRDGGRDAAFLPIRDGDVRCESTECRSAAGTCCPRPDGTWYCCGGISSCDYDAGRCECYGNDPCAIGYYCCGENDAGVMPGACVGLDTYARWCERHSPGG